ncbi:tetratricopeptide repeat protein [Chitinophaga arvensicola]|uniref:Tfp pilus assembly protein PilF n=1 Tax=Chitinophaga arvensicola TaxID=29529 RepID=A0A1I0S985_9BACT|nr:tetratricopeptide repeat protein [Chitinophaga arvensicola]SEW52721.1 Tfp pilus assembly protein PilF [Chitinophaga arvensicola]
MKRIVNLFSILITTSCFTLSASGQHATSENAASLFMEAQFAKAKSLSGEAMQADRKDALAYAIHARTLMVDNDLSTAQVELLEAIRLSPGNGVYYAFQAACYQFQNNPAQAAKINEKALQLLASPKTALEYYARGIVEESMKKEDAALADYSKSIELNSRLALSYVKRGKIYAKRKLDDIGEYSKAIAINPAYGGAYFTRANSYYDKQQYDPAIADYSKVILLDPKDVDAYFNRGVMYKKKGMYDPALADYARVIELSPKDASIYGNRGNIYLLTEKPDQAFNDYSKAIELDPNSALYRVSRASVYLRWEQWDAAFNDYNKAIQLDPKNADAYLERGNIYLNQKQQPELAFADFNKVVEINPNYSNGYLNMGVVHHNKQQYAQAITDYTKAIETDPANQLAYFNRADAYESIGNIKQANIDRKKYADLGGKLQASGGKTRQEIFPQGTFDAKLAEAALGRGLSRIIGKACTKRDGLIFPAAGVKVMLFPVTPYLEEWYALRDKKESKKTGVYMSTEANKYAIEAITNSDGRFSFEGLKPGKYFIQLIHSFNQLKTAKVYTGSYTAQNGPVMQTTNYYYNQDYTVAREQRLERFVEIKEDGDTRKVTMANGLIKLCDF